MWNITLEALLLATLGGFAALFLVLSKDYNSTAALFPQWIALASLAFLAVLIIRLVVRSKEPHEPPEPPEELGKRPTAIVLVEGAYIILIFLAGFFAATFFFLLIAPVQMRYERRGVVLMHAVVLTLMLAGSFSWLFNIQLPTGAIWDLW